MANRRTSAAPASAVFVRHICEAIAQPGRRRYSHEDISPDIRLPF